jgi:glutaredoxin 3
MYEARKRGRPRPHFASSIMAKIEIYTSIMCPHCSRAVRLLQSKNVNFEQIDVSMNSGLRQNMRLRDNEHIGGCDDLMALEFAGRLDALIKKPIP